MQCPRCQKETDPRDFGILYTRNTAKEDPRWGWITVPENPETVCFGCWDKEHEAARHAAHRRGA